MSFKPQEAMILQTAGILLIIMFGLLATQCLYFRSTIYAYTNTAQYNLAHTLKNLAEAQKIKDGQTIKFNQGQVSLKADEYEVKLTNNRIYHFE